MTGRSGLKSREQKEKQDKHKHKIKHILAKNKLQHTENTMTTNTTFEIKKERHPAIPEENDVQHYPICNSGDSSEGEQVPKNPVPRWAKCSAKNFKDLRDFALIDHSILCKWITYASKTPELSKIFTGLNPRWVRRTSSARWTTPPRYSELPKF
uniref:Uncharacterized protein n=1 Tax=Timema tahoe TaxID=61484 RepID=A0A7R9I9Y4_9NEOP|nr:unnamed protein product [Timema tahoe]